MVIGSSVFFFSDLHLRSGQEEQTLSLTNFFKNLISNPPQIIFFVGDIFDVWVADFSYFKNEYSDLIDSLRTLGELGVRIVYFQGNHDLYLEDFWRDELGWEVYREPHSFELFGTTFHVEHGDLMNPNDRSYLLLKKTLNHPFFEKLVKGIPGSVVNLIGNRMSSASRKKNSVSKRVDRETVRRMIRSFAIRRHEETQCQYIVSGHVHVRDEWWDGDRSFCSINLGSWHDHWWFWCWSPSNGGQWLDLSHIPQKLEVKL